MLFSPCQTNRPMVSQHAGTHHHKNAGAARTPSSKTAAHTGKTSDVDPHKATAKAIEELRTHVLFDLAEIRRNHAEMIQAHPRLKVLLDEAALGVTGKDARGVPYWGPKQQKALEDLGLNKTHIHSACEKQVLRETKLCQSLKEITKLVRSFVPSRAGGKKAARDLLSNLVTTLTLQGTRKQNALMLGAYGAAAAAAAGAHKMAYRPEHIAALGRSVAEASKKARRSLGYDAPEAPEKKKEVEPKIAEEEQREEEETPEAAPVVVEPTLRPEASRGWWGARGLRGSAAQA